MPTIAHISDLHLQSGVPERQTQVEPILQKINEMKPDLVVISGDVTDDGWDSLDELKWAKDWLDARINSPQMVLPGNHDVGNFANAEEGPINSERLDRWRSVFDTNECREFDHWWIVGVNSMTFGLSGNLASDHFSEISHWIMEADWCKVPIALFQHSPFFSKSIDEKNPAIDYWVGPKNERQIIWKQIQRDKTVKLIGSGHVHQSRLTEVDGIKIAWAPPASGTCVHSPGLPNPPMPEKTGFFLHHLHDDGRVESELVECAPMLKCIEFNPWP
ncbi:MAG: metallophosphoesterase family protein [Phycisphaeraceae bacterium]|jgi:alkaline phosphatase D